MEITRNLVLSALEREAYSKLNISEGTWTLIEQGLHLYTNYTLLGAPKIAAFDLVYSQCMYHLTRTTH